MDSGRPAKASTETRDLGGARSAVVNRTHRGIRDEALKMQERRSRSRGLFAPLLICSALLLVICYAIWSVMAGYDLIPTSVPDASDQVLLLLLWSLPITVVVLALIWLRRRNRNGGQPL